MAETFRIAKLEKFIQKKVEFMEYQQKVIEEIKKHGVKEGKEVELQVVHVLETSNTNIYNTVFELCQEFEIKMPHVLGVTPNV